MSKGMTLLYIEDDPQARDAANSLFSDFFDDVIVGFDGEDGARLFASNYHKIDLVITDITMPRMNGIEMIHAIRQINPDIAIIVLSAHNETITPPINNLNYVIILDGKNRRKKIITKRVV